MTPEQILGWLPALVFLVFMLGLGGSAAIIAFRRLHGMNDDVRAYLAANSTAEGARMVESSSPARENCDLRPGTIGRGSFFRAGGNL